MNQLPKNIVEYLDKFMENSGEIDFSEGSLTGEYKALLCKLQHLGEWAKNYAEDKVTGLISEETFLKNTKRLIEHHPNYNYMIIAADVEKFRVYNDVFGFDAGDAFLRAVAQRISGCLDDEMTACRYHSDHFLVCMKEEKCEVEKLVEQAAKWIYEYSDEFKFIPNFGIYLVENKETDVKVMCDRALLALRTVKENPSIRYAYYSSDMINKLVAEQEIVNEMNEALKEGQFEVFLQPQYKCATKKIIAAEALTRWNHPTKGYILPGLFIPLFEKNGFITKLDKYVWEQVCKYLRNSIDVYGIENTVPISVNVSRVDLYNPDLCAFLLELMEKNRLPHEYLRLEITEKAYMEDPIQLIETVEALQFEGFKIEMDDFGSGYSSLNILKDVPTDILKLDLMFLEESKNAEKGSKILGSIIRMAKLLKIPVIAEGVETKVQWDYLRGIGCEYAQGYFFARPMPIYEFEKLLQSK